MIQREAKECGVSPKGRESKKPKVKQKSMMCHQRGSDDPKGSQRVWCVTEGKGEGRAMNQQKGKTNRSEDMKQANTTCSVTRTERFLEL